MVHLVDEGVLNAADFAGERLKQRI
jgi:hypothetical protein